MMKILAFAASSNTQSINKQLANYAANLVEAAQVELLDINDYEMPLFSEDRERILGQPREAQAFYQKISDADAIIIAFAEHNASYTAAYKNLFDWTSRIDRKVYQDKPVVTLAASPGPGGAKNVLAAATTSAPYFGANVVGSLSISQFYQHFDADTQSIHDEATKESLMNALAGLTVLEAE